MAVIVTKHTPLNPINVRLKKKEGGKCFLAKERASWGGTLRSVFTFKGIKLIRGYVIICALGFSKHRGQHVGLKYITWEVIMLVKNVTINERKKLNTLMFGIDK